MFGEKPKSYGEEISEKVDDILKQIQNDRDLYDEETERQLKEVRDSDWHTTKYLREILWELRYAQKGKQALKERKMIIIEVLNLLVLLFIALNAACILNFLIRITGDISSIQDYQSRKHAKIVAKDMKKKGYVMTEKGKELLKANTGKDI